MPRLELTIDVAVPRWSRWIAHGLIATAGALVNLASWIVQRSVRITPQ